MNESGIPKFYLFHMMSYLHRKGAVAVVLLTGEVVVLFKIKKKVESALETAYSV